MYILLLYSSLQDSPFKLEVPPKLSPCKHQKQIEIGQAFMREACWLGGLQKGRPDLEVTGLVLQDYHITAPQRAECKS